MSLKTWVVILLLVMAGGAGVYVVEDPTPQDVLLVIYKIDAFFAELGPEPAPGTMASNSKYSDHPDNIAPNDPGEIHYVPDDHPQTSAVPVHHYIGDELPTVRHTSFYFDSMTRGIAYNASQRGISNTTVNKSWKTPNGIVPPKWACSGRSMVYVTDVIIQSDDSAYLHPTQVTERIADRMLEDPVVMDFFGDGVRRGGIGVWGEFEPYESYGTKGTFYVAVTICENQ